MMQVYLNLCKYAVITAQKKLCIKFLSISANCKILLRVMVMIFPLNVKKQQKTAHFFSVHKIFVHLHNIAYCITIHGNKIYITTQFLRKKCTMDKFLSIGPPPQNAAMQFFKKSFFQPPINFLTIHGADL